jgi:hypothetical protein
MVEGDTEMTDENKKLDEVKPQEEFFLVDRANVMAIVGIPLSKLGGEIIKSVKWGEFKKIDKNLLKMNFMGEDTIIFPSGTKISNDLFKVARKTADAWGCEKENIEFYEKFEDGKFRKDYVVLIVIDEAMCFIVAPRVEDSDVESGC